MRVNNLDEIVLYTKGMAGIVKSPGIWATINCTMYPLCYLLKPKWMSEELWKDFLSRLRITYNNSSEE